MIEFIQRFSKDLMVFLMIFISLSTYCQDVESNFDIEFDEDCKFDTFLIFRQIALMVVVDRGIEFYTLDSNFNRIGNNIKVISIESPPSFFTYMFKAQVINDDSNDECSYIVAQEPLTGLLYRIEGFEMNETEQFIKESIIARGNLDDQYILEKLKKKRQLTNRFIINKLLKQVSYYKDVNILKQFKVSVKGRVDYCACKYREIHIDTGVRGINRPRILPTSYKICN